MKRPRKCAYGGRWACAVAFVVGVTAAVAASPANGLEPGVAVAFAARSYVPGDVARLVVWSEVEPLSVQLFRVGAERRRARADDELEGVPVGPARRAYGRTIRIAMPHRASGLYFLRAQSATGAVGFAPFVLRPRTLGVSRVLVVLPTNTWQAYNFRDLDRNGLGDTWYDDDDFNGVDLARPHLNRGVPFHFRQYDLGFLRWLAKRGHKPDFAADDDLEYSKGKELARRYDLIVFPGHEEYVNDAAWEATESFRDLGGNIAFLSANNFFYRVERRGRRLYRLGRWRDSGRSEAGLKGVEYEGFSKGQFPNRPYVVTGARALPWFFAGTGLRNGARFGRYGIEVDQRAPDSPPRTIALARIRDIFGPVRSAEMTYYTTKAGAKVFSAGVMNFGGSAEWPVVARLLDNLWRKLSRP
jgi:N,N-dimethylformamidase beta subunit-like, C-terminal